MAHPTSQGGLGATASQLQWIVDAYTLVFAGLLLTAGSLGDRFGRYRFLAIGLVDLRRSVRSVGVGATPPTTLIFTRSLMGVGAAFIMPATLSIITNVFTDPTRARQGDRHLGRRVGARRRPRPDHRRHPARALLVGIGVHGERADRDRRAGARLLARPRVEGSVARRARPARRRAVDRAPSARSCGRSSKRRARDGRRTRSSPRSSSASWCSAAFFAWELHSTHPMLDMRFFENPRFSAASGAITLVFLVDVRHALLDDAVPAVGARLLDRQGRRGAHAAGRSR